MRANTIIGRALKPRALHTLLRKNPPALQARALRAGMMVNLHTME